VDNKYITNLCIKTLPETIYFSDIFKILPYNFQYDFSIFVNKIDAIKAINDITYNIGSTISDLKTISQNSRDIDIIDRTKEETLELRKKIQTENQEVYYLNLIITFYSYNFNELVKFLSEFKSKLYSKGILSEITNFRHKDAYLSNLPIYLKKPKLLKDIVITTDALSNLFPFFKNNVMDINGIIIGKNNQNQICKLDIWDKKYENSNMCIFGSSGSGKSFFTKLFCIRNYIQGTCQIILDIEEEYISMCKSLRGQVMFDNSYYNIMQITYSDLEKQNYLKEKVNKIVSFLSIFRNIDKDYFYNKIMSLYNLYEITNERNSVLISNIGDKVILDEVIRDKKDFPSLTNLLSYIDDEKQYTILSDLIDNELKYLSQSTTIIENSNLYVINTKNIIMYPKLLQYILKNIVNQKQKHNTLVIIDEVWKYAKIEDILDEIFSLYKTIRKRNAAIMCITQDVNDFFEYKNGFYANSILNNCNFKVFFKLTYKESNMYIKFPQKVNLKLLDKGEGVLCINENYLKFKVEINAFEREIINENDSCNKK